MNLTDETSTNNKLLEKLGNSHFFHFTDLLSLKTIIDNFLINSLLLFNLINKEMKRLLTIK